MGQRARVDQGVGAVAAVHQVGVILAGDFDGQGLVQVAGQEFKLEFDAQLVLDLLEDLVVGGGLLAGIADEHRDGDRLFFRDGGGYQRQYQRQHQQYGQQLLHVVCLPCSF